MNCQDCGQTGPVKYFEYHQNIGMILAHVTRSKKAIMCQKCSRKSFRKMTGLTLLTGWWGFQSMFWNVGLIFSNLWELCRTLKMTNKKNPQAPVANTQIGPQNFVAKGNPYQQNLQ